MPYKDREKQLAYLANHYQQNKSDYIQRSNEQKRRFREWMHELKNGPCVDCGGRFHYAAMHWDHRPGVDKVDDIARLSHTLNKEVVLNEIVKCDLVCANCHAVRTHERGTYFGRTSDTDVTAA